MICQYKQEKDRLPDCNLPSVEAVPGFEHGDTGLADHCLAAWLHRHKNNSNSISYFFEKVNLILLFSMIRFLSIFINRNLHIIMEMISTLFKERLSMNFTYEFPDITGYIQKSGTYKKPRRISGLRLGENRTAVENVSPFLSPAVMKIKILITLPFLRKKRFLSLMKKSLLSAAVS